MKNIILLLFLGLILSVNTFSQCSGFMDFDFNPQYPPNSTYPPNTEIVFCCTMTGWNGNGEGANWLEGFGLTLGDGWASVTPLQPPNDADIESGDWIWVNTVTSDATGFVAGPGYFFEGPSGPIDGNPGNDWGDSCPDGDCVWEFCITLTTSNNVGESLLIGVTPYADGTMGSWGFWECFDGPTIWNGTVGCVTYGCTNQIACNYNPNVDCDDGSCLLPGCTDNTACNFNPNAPCDDGSCTYGGCTDPDACNFDPNAGCDNGTCGYFSMGDIEPCPNVVCTGLEVIYSVDGNNTSTYLWSLNNGGIIQSEQDNNCEIIWGNTSGTYTVSVQEITEEGCEGIVKTCEVTVVEPDITFDSEYKICLNQTVTLSANPIGGIWSGEHINGNVFIGSESGDFYPTYSVNINGCDYQESVLVEVEPQYINPTLSYGKTFLDFCFDTNAQVYSSSDDRSLSFVWSIDGLFGSVNNGTLMVDWQDTSKTYLISVYGIDGLGCKSDTSNLYVRTEACQTLYAPNTFTPNGDGINDVFKITGLSIYEPLLRVFNRWGVEIYTSTNLQWNGDGGNGYYCGTDVYNWTVSYRDKNGFNKEQSGFVTLIR